LGALRRPVDAEAALRAAQAGAAAREARPLQWRIHAALGNLYKTQARQDDANREFSAARAIIEELAADVPDEAVRQAFLPGATAQLPRLRPRSPLQTAKQASGGLTRREREVAALVAQGKSNRAIAETLFVGERTVAGHVSSILAKLKFTSRAQIAIWAQEQRAPRRG
jgi:DNA-binding NarL/FixJ family response regulator